MLPSEGERDMADFDYVLVGGGLNALVAAAMLGKKGRTALALDRNPAIGGCLRTEAITAPGFVHDVMATTLVLFRTSPAYEALGKDLEARGFAFADTNLPTGVLRPDGSSVIFSMDRARNVKTFEALAEGDGQAFAAEMDSLGADAPFLFSLLGGSLWSWGTARTTLRRAWPRGSAKRSRPRAAISRRRTGRTRCARSGRRGCCTRAWGPRAPIRRRWRRWSPSRSKRRAARSRSAARRRCFRRSSG